MEHITFDLETLGNTSNAPIVQIGAVKFNIDGQITDQFLRNVKLQSLDRYDFYVDYRTVGWWLCQSDAAIKSVFCTEDRVDLRQALREYIEWIGKTSEYYYWSHSNFDPPILINNMRLVNLPSPIPFRLYMDIRTLCLLCGKKEVERDGIEHNALDDARFQAAYISESLLSHVDIWKDLYDDGDEAT